MLKMIDVIKQKNTLGLKVSILADGLLACDSLHSFEGNFNSGLKKIFTGNHTHAHVQYHTVIENEFEKNMRIAVQHYKIKDGWQTIMYITKNL